MKGLVRALLIFLGGLAVTAVFLLGTKFLLVTALGERLYRLPELQMERLSVVLRERPATNSKVLVLGDSTAAFSIDAGGLHDAFSLAVSNSTVIEAYYSLKKVLESGARPGCVLASFSFTWELNRDYFWTMFLANRFFSESELAELLSVSSAFGEMPGRMWRWGFLAKKFALERHILDGFSPRRIQDAISVINWGNVRAKNTRVVLSKHKGSYPLINANSFEGRLDLVFAGEPEMTKTEKEYFARFLSLLAENQIRLFLLQVPFAASISISTAADYWKKFKALLMEAGPASSYTLIAPPSMPDPLYISAGHLSKEGIRRMEPFIQAALSGAGCYSGGVKSDNGR